MRGRTSLGLTAADSRPPSVLAKMDGPCDVSPIVLITCPATTLFPANENVHMAVVLRSTAPFRTICRALLPLVRLMRRLRPRRGVRDQPQGRSCGSPRLPPIATQSFRRADLLTGWRRPSAIQIFRAPRDPPPRWVICRLGAIASADGTPTQPLPRRLRASSPPRHEGHSLLCATPVSGVRSRRPYQSGRRLWRGRRSHQWARLRRREEQDGS